MNIFVAKLSGATTSDDLRELFEEFGEVKSSKVIIDRETGNSKRYGFVEMDNDAEALSAIKALNGSEFDNAEIVVKESKPKGNSQQDGRFRRNNFNNRDRGRY